MKQCSRCKLDLPLTEFGKKGSFRQSKCKKCQREYAKAHYKANRDKYIHKARTRNIAVIEENFALVLELKKVGCADCGITNPVVLQFDHVTGTKVTNVSNMVARGWSADKILEEVKKCEVVCANCHLIRTAERASRVHRYK